LKQNEVFFEGPGYFETKCWGFCHNSKKIGHWAVQEADKFRADMPTTGIIATPIPGLLLWKGLPFFDLQHNSQTLDKYSNMMFKWSIL
jgi:hypothetical protein